MNRRTQAFTLLEVTLATAIFATAVVVLTSAFANALTVMHRMHEESDYAPIVRYVRSKIITVKNLYGFKKGEELDLPDGGTMKWEADVEQVPGIADLFSVTLTMDFDRKDKDAPLTITDKLYLLRPTWSDADDRATIISDAKTDLETERRTSH